MSGYDTVSDIEHLYGVTGCELRGRPVVRHWFHCMPKGTWVHRTLSVLWATRRAVILQRQHHILHVAQVRFLRADDGSSRDTQDFLGDDLAGPLVFRCNRALVEQALGQFIAWSTGAVGFIAVLVAGTVRRGAEPFQRKWSQAWRELLRDLSPLLEPIKVCAQGVASRTLCKSPIDPSWLAVPPKRVIFCRCCLVIPCVAYFFRPALAPFVSAIFFFELLLNRLPDGLAGAGPHDSPVRFVAVQRD